MAWAGSPGVENTFRICSVEFSSQTQSVNVPPLSMAILRGAPALAELCAALVFSNRIVTLWRCHPVAKRVENPLQRVINGAESKKPRGCLCYHAAKRRLTREAFCRD